MKTRIMLAIGAVAMTAGGFAVYALCARCERIGVKMADLADCLQAGCSVLGALAVLAIMVVLILDVFLAEDDIKSGPAHLRPDATDDSGHVCGAGRLRDRGVGAPDCGGRPS